MNRTSLQPAQIIMAGRSYWSTAHNSRVVVSLGTVCYEGEITLERAVYLSDQGKLFEVVQPGGKMYTEDQVHKLVLAAWHEGYKVCLERLCTYADDFWEKNK